MRKRRMGYNVSGEITFGVPVNFDTEDGEDPAGEAIQIIANRWASSNPTVLAGLLEDSYVDADLVLEFIALDGPEFD